MTSEELDARLALLGFELFQPRHIAPYRRLSRDTLYIKVYQYRRGFYEVQAELLGRALLKEWNCSAEEVWGHVDKAMKKHHDKRRT